MINRVKIGLCLLVLIGVGCQSCTKKKEEKKVTETVKKEVMPEKLLRHVVLFKFKDEAPDAEVNKLNDMFNALPSAIPEIKDFEWGINDSPENFHQDFTHCYLVTFGSEQDRDSVYSPHPKHQEFVAALQPHLEKVFVVDYWAN